MVIAYSALAEAHIILQGAIEPTVKYAIQLCMVY